MTLNEEQISFYQENGYLVIDKYGFSEASGTAGSCIFFIPIYFMLQIQISILMKEIQQS
jgi:hypothetical protein